MRIAAAIALLSCALGVYLAARAADSTVTIAWDYPTNAPLPGFALLWGTNRFEAGTNLTASVQVNPGLHRFTALAVRNGLESDPSNELTVRVISFTLERSGDLSSWIPLQTFAAVTTNGTAQTFYRVRVTQ